MNTHKLIAMGLALACLSGASPGKSLVHDFTWMTGHWCQDHEGEVIEEQWLKPSGGLVVGMGRTVKNGQATAFEFARIEYREGTPHFVAQPRRDRCHADGLNGTFISEADFELPICRWLRSDT